MKEKYESIEELLEDYTPEQILELINDAFEYTRYVNAIKGLLDVPERSDEEVEEAIEAQKKFRYARLFKE